MYCRPYIFLWVPNGGWVYQGLLLLVVMDGCVLLMLKFRRLVLRGHWVTAKAGVQRGPYHFQEFLLCHLLRRLLACFGFDWLLVFGSALCSVLCFFFFLFRSLLYL